MNNRSYVPTREEAHELQHEILNLEAQLTSLGVSESTSAHRNDITLEILKRKSMCAPVHRIPTEILGEIFYQCVATIMDEDSDRFTSSSSVVIDPNHAPWLLTRICWRWRCVASATQKIWTHIALDAWNFRKSNPTPAILMSLENSGQSDLVLSIRDHDYRIGLGAEFSSLLNIATKELYRCSYLRIDSYQESPFLRLLPSVNSLPRLRHLALEASWPEGLTFYSPNLSTLYSQTTYLHGMVLKAFPTSQHMRSLHLNLGFIQVPEFLQFMSNFPELRYANFYASSVEDRTQGVHEKVTLEHLEVLEFAMAYPDVPLLTMLCLPSLRELSLTAPSGSIENGTIIPSGCSQSLKSLSMTGFRFTGMPQLFSQLEALDKLELIDCILLGRVMKLLALPVEGETYLCSQLRELGIFPFGETLVQPFLGFLQARGFTGNASPGVPHVRSLEVIQVSVTGFEDGKQTLEKIGVKVIYC